VNEIGSPSVSEGYASEHAVRWEIAGFRCREAWGSRGKMIRTYITGGPKASEIEFGGRYLPQGANRANGDRSRGGASGRRLTAMADQPGNPARMCLCIVTVYGMMRNNRPSGADERAALWGVKEGRLQPMEKQAQNIQESIPKITRAKTRRSSPFYLIAASSSPDALKVSTSTR